MARTRLKADTGSHQMALPLGNEGQNPPTLEPGNAGEQQDFVQVMQDVYRRYLDGRVGSGRAVDRAQAGMTILAVTGESDDPLNPMLQTIEQPAE